MRMRRRRISTTSIPILLLSRAVVVGLLITSSLAFAFGTVDNNVAQQRYQRRQDHYDGSSCSHHHYDDNYHHYHPQLLVQQYRRSIQRIILRQRGRRLSLSSSSSSDPSPRSSTKSSASSSSLSKTSSTASSSPPTTTTSSSFTSFTDLLLEYDTTTPITFQGYVLTKRKFGKQLVFVDFHVDPTSTRDLMLTSTASSEDIDEDLSDTDTTKYLCPAMLRQDFFQGTATHYTGYKKCMLAGAKYEIVGVASPTRIPGNVVLLIKHLRLLELPRQIQHIQSILTTAGKHKLIPQDEFHYACRHYLKSQGIASLKLEPPPSNSDSDNSMTEHRWIKQLSKVICTNLPHDPNFPNTIIEQSFKQQHQRRQQNGGINNINNYNKYNVPIAPPEYQNVPSEVILMEASVVPQNLITVNEVLQELQQAKTRGSSISDSSATTTTTTALNTEDDDGDDDNYEEETMGSLSPTSLSSSLSTSSSVLSTSSSVTSTTVTSESTTSSTASESVVVRYFAISGWIQNRRRFDNNITTFSIVDNVTSLLLSPKETLKPGTESENSSGISTSASSSPKNQQRLNCILHPEYCVRAEDSSSPSKSVNKSPASIYRNLVSVGAKIAIEGYIVVHSDDGKKKPTLWIRHIRLLQCTSRSATIKYLLDILHDGKISLEEVSKSLLLEPSSSKGKELLKLTTPTQRQWKANELAVTIQESIKKQQHMDLLDANVGGGVKNPKLAILDKYRYINKLFPIMESSNHDEKIEAAGEEEDTFSPQDQYRRGMMPNRSKNGLAGRRAGGSNIRHHTSRYEHKKVPQMVWMEQEIREVLQSHPEYKKRKLHILDIGGGKGNLATFLGQAFDNDEEDLVDIHVIDICEEAITNAQKKVEQQQQRSLQQLSSQASSSRAKTTTTAVNYQLADASSPTTMKNLPFIQPDVVVALHACGHLTDVALSYATSNTSELTATTRAGFVIVPCCFNSNRHLRVPPNKEIVHEWLNLPSEDDWSSLKLLAEVQNDITLANEAIGIICGIRANAVMEKRRRRYEEVTNTNIEGSSSPPPVPDIYIKRFPIQYSTRNTVLVGMCS